MPQSWQHQIKASALCISDYVADFNLDFSAILSHPGPRQPELEPEEHLMDMSQIMALLIGQGQRWVKEQRQAFRSRGRALSPSTLAQFLPFFEESLLQEVRLVAVPALENPGFLEDYRQDLLEKAIPLLDFSSMAAITFVDTILVVEAYLPEPPGGLIFHELVHAVQYDLLGADKFVELYILGWVNQGFNYSAIPLEMDAYELQNRYEADPAGSFSVNDEVSRSLELMMED